MASDEATKSEAGTDGGRGSKRPSIRPGGAASLLGVTISGRYRIERLIGEGGMGAVYQAEHVHMRKRLAIKVLHPEMSRLSEVVARFENEAMAASHIDHPNVATATDFGKLDDGSFFLVLEFIDGKSLRDAINDGRIEVGRALHIMRQIAAALGRAHSLKIVHRDLKPENVMLVERDGDSDFVKVLDFGIAKVPVGELARTAEPGKVLTQLGMVYGTPEYMAPEQALGQNVDARADLYALGCMTFEMLTGSRPYDHESKVALLGMHVTAAIPLASERAPEAMIPPEVDQLLVRCLAKEATERFQDAKELIDATNTVLAALISIGRIDPKYLGHSGPQSSQLGMQPLSLGNPRASLAGVGTPTATPGVAGAYRGTTTGNVPLNVQDPSQPVRRFAPKMLAAVGAGVTGVLVLVVVFIVVLTHKGGAQTLADGGVALTTADVGTIAQSSSGGSSGNAVTPPPPRPDIDAQIKQAVDLCDKGDYHSAIEQLAALALANPGRAEIHRALVDAYMGTKRQAEAMDEAKETLDLDPTLVKDKDLRAQIRNAALTGGKDAEDKSFLLMTDKMGSDGPDALYDIAYLTQGYPKPSTRAKTTLKRADVRARGTDELRLALDVHEVAARSPCELHKYLDRAAEIGDWRTARVLKSYTASSGCGFLGRRDCWPCLHGDGALQKAIRTIDARKAD
jgi:serine/threonine-protein kinase